MAENKTAAIIYPHQLFRANPALDEAAKAFLVEDPLLFKQFRFHKKKLVLHRASMKSYEAFIRDRVSGVEYLDADKLDRSGDIARLLAEEGVQEVRYVDPVDDWLETRLLEGLKQKGIGSKRFESPMFLNSRERVDQYFGELDSFHMTGFYREERERLGILIDADGNPEGGKLTFDTENRKKLPKGIEVPDIEAPPQNEFVREAVEYVEDRFPDNYGEAGDFFYPVTFDDAEAWLERFLGERFEKYGPYQDSIAKGDRFLFHSILTPMMNCGLLTPARVIDRTLEHAEGADIPMNSLEGFIRQIVGWREFVRGVYVSTGRRQRTSNFWGHEQRLPKGFWKAETGIDPVDDAIRGLLETGYSHHIERLMILANFMTLTEIHPDEAYRWFMEMYIDAYDWVMVPNVYGMGLYADGGLITTKPYISGSNYIRKMSDYGEGEWSEIWDGLYWRFIGKHKAFFDSNPRLRMMPRMLEKMDTSRKKRLYETAEDFLERFHQS